MKLSDFILLSEEEKNFIVLHTGILIGKRIFSNYFVFLFQLDTFYVELYCNQENKSIQEYRVFKETTQLNAYIENIPLDDLL